MSVFDTDCNVNLYYSCTIDPAVDSMSMCVTVLRFYFFNQFEAKLSTLLEQLRGHTNWEEDEELRNMPRPRGRKRKSKFVKQQQLFAHWGHMWLPVTIVDVLPHKYYNVHWTNSNEISSVRENELELVKPAKTGKRTKPCHNSDCDEKTMVKTFVKKKGTPRPSKAHDF